MFGYILYLYNFFITDGGLMRIFVSLLVLSLPVLVPYLVWAENKRKLDHIRLLEKKLRDNNIEDCYFD